MKKIISKSLICVLIAGITGCSSSNTQSTTEVQTTSVVAEESVAIASTTESQAITEATTTEAATAEQATTELVTTEAATTEETTEATSQAPYKLEDYKFKDTDGLYDITKLIDIGDNRITSVCFGDEETVLVVSEDKDNSTINVGKLSLETGIFEKMVSVSYTNDDPENLAASEWIVENVSPLLLYNNVNNEFLAIGDDGEISGQYKIGTRQMDFVKMSDGICFADKTDRIKWINYSLTEEKYLYDMEENIAVKNVISCFGNDRYLIVTGVYLNELAEKTFVYDLEEKKFIASIEEKISVVNIGDSMYCINKVEDGYEVSRINVAEDNTINLEKLSYECNVFPCDYYIYGDKIFFPQASISEVNLGILDLANQNMITSKGFKIEDYEELEFKADPASETELISGFNELRFAKEGIFTGNKAVFLNHFNSQNGERNMVILWDSKDFDSQNQQVSAETTVSEDYALKELVDYGELSRKADVIYEKYGVRVFFGDNAVCHNEFYDTSILQDLNAIEKNLNILENILGLFPEDMFRQIYNDGYLNGFMIFLNGDLTAKTYGTLSKAGGFTTDAKGYQIIVIDASNTSFTDNTICHELAHAFFNKIFLTRGEFDDEGWDKINPEGFEYLSKYSDASGHQFNDLMDDTYTAQACLTQENYDLDSIYFAYTYSKTYRDEDIATVFAVAMNKETTLSAYISPRLKEKLKIISAALRTNYDTTGWPEVTKWEEALTWTYGE